jgi:hypothetical protein
MNTLAISLLLAVVSADQLDFRPPAGSAPWYKTAKPTSLTKPGYPINYFVPNFGLDVDIKRTHKSIRQAEKEYKTEIKASFKKPKGHPVDYFVPNFGMDRDIKVSLNNLEKAERRLKRKIRTPKHNGSGTYEIPIEKNKSYSYRKSL